MSKVTTVALAMAFIFVLGCSTTEMKTFGKKTAKDAAGEVSDKHLGDDTKKDKE